MGTLKNLLLKVLVSAVQKMKSCEGASLAVSLLPSDTDLLRDLGGFFFHLYEPLSLNSVEMVLFSKTNEHLFKHMLNSILAQQTM